MEKIMKILSVLLRKAKTFITAVMNDNIGIYAAQASFFIIISAVPFIMLLLTLVKFFVPMDQMTVLEMINRFAPDTVSNFLTTIVNELFSKTSTAPIISITAVSTLWIASKGVMALYLGINNVFKPQKMPNYFYSRFISILYTLIFIAALLLTIIVFGFGGKIEAFLLAKLPFIGAVLAFFMNIRILVFIIILTLVFALFYSFLPQAKKGFKYQLPGALCAAAGWILFSFVYSVYIEYFSNYSYVYGSLAAIVFLMLWLYFCMNILLYGAEINKLYEERFQKKY